MAVQRGIDKAVDAALEHLDTLTKRLSKKEEMKQVARSPRTTTNRSAR